MKTQNREIGRVGERLAEEFLIKKGMQIVARNFSTRFGEIDLIMRDKEVLVFVEVKTKNGREFGSPEEMFGKQKYYKVRKMAELFMKGNLQNCRVDMVAVVLGLEKEIQEIQHYENLGAEFES